MGKKPRVHKTNAMRELDVAGIDYEERTYDEMDVGREYGKAVAEALGEDPDAAFKTLVLQGGPGTHVVCCIPVSQELDLKKAAAAAGEKRLELLPLKELEPLTGYVRGGCSPVGMRHRFPTIIDETAQLHDRIAISGGRRGLQLILRPDDLVGFLDGSYGDLC